MRQSTRRRSPRQWLVAAAAVVVVAAGTSAIVARGAPTSEVVGARDSNTGTGHDEQLTCADFDFPASALNRQPLDDSTSGLEVEALRDLLKSPMFSQASLSWRELARSDSTVTYGAGEPPLLDGFASVELRDGEWRPGVYGSGCVVRPSTPGAVPVRWGFAQAPDPNSNTLVVVANDQQCAGSAGAEARVDPQPEVADSPEQVVLTFTARPLGGSQTCPTHPPVTLTVTLQEPIGTRQFFDGGIYPPQPPCRVENADCVGVAQELAERE